MGIAQPPPPSRNYNLSYLTDIFDLSVMYHVEDIGVMGSNVSPIDSNRSSPLAHRYTGPITRSRKNDDGNENEEGVVFLGAFGCEEDESHEQRQEKIDASAHSHEHALLSLVPMLQWVILMVIIWC